tara:strand:- start:387 stop:764 length:378 start_codon:yes stop_codon:yes gene_type:complete
VVKKDDWRTHEEWVEIQLNIGRKRARREQKQCQLTEAGPARVRYRVKKIDIIFVDHDDGNGVGRLVGTDYFHPDIPHHLYGELEKEAEMLMYAIRRHIREVRAKKKTSVPSDQHQMSFDFITKPE